MNTEHFEITRLLPWYVNGTLGDCDHQRVDAHLASCDRCREDLGLEMRVHAGVSTGTAVEYVPAVSLNRLRARLDGLPSQLRLEPGVEVPDSETPALHRQGWGGWRVASLASLAVVLGLAAISDPWHDLHSRSPASYHTVTSPVAQVPNAVIRAVFSADMKLGDLQQLLDRAQLSIVAGPSDAGVYSLASKSTRNPRESLARLRQDAAVRFAELVPPLSRESGSP